MESILESQFQIMDAMDKFLINFKKDGPDRKSPDHIKRRLQILDTYWAEFETNHEKLYRSDIDKSQCSYFMEKRYESAKRFYQNTREYVSNYQVQQKPTTPMLKPSAFNFESTAQEHSSSSPAPRPRESTSRGSPSKTEDLLRKQQSNFRAYDRTVSTIDLDTMKEKWEFEDALKTIQSRWQTIDSLHWEIDSECEVVYLDYEQAFTQHEISYNKLKKEINSKMWSICHKEKSTPKVEIPTFQGSYQQWTSFKDLFNEAIHSNASLNNAQKMQFLKGKLKGEAEKLIQHLAISSDNYETCWDILNNRYENKKLIFSSHMNTLLNLPSMQQQSSASIKQIHDTANECIYAIKNLGVNVEASGPILEHLLSQKLDNETHNDYIESLTAPRELPTLAHFLKYLEAKFTSLETSRYKQDVVKPNQQPKKDSSPSNKQSSSNSSNNNQFNRKAFSTSKDTGKHKSNFKAKPRHAQKCPLCQNEHSLFYCETFLGLQPDAKRKVVDSYNLCKNCLYDHNGKECYSQKRCRECDSDHHTTLHDAYCPSTSNNQNKTAEQNDTKPASSMNSHVSQEDISEILLATAQVNVSAGDGSQITLRALIDQGSQISLITEKAAQRLRLPRKRCKGVISGIGAKENNCKGVISITCSSIYSEYEFDTDVYIMRNLINNLPNKSFNKPSWPYLKNIDLADPNFYSSQPVDLLLGADVYSSIIQEGIIRPEKSQPVAQQTRLGWIISGSVRTFQCNVVINNLLDVQAFWSTEDIKDTSDMTDEDQQCLQLYKNTTKRQNDGRYIVNLPMQENFEEKLGTSKPKAAAQFRQLEKKFNRQQKLAEAYKLFIKEYQSLNHMTECTGNTTPSFYLPHHCVQRTDSTTTALRVVFNASAQTSTGYTLNDLMKRGPNLQRDLMSLILKWRQYPYAFTADIEKMFRQILVSENHQQLQKILWRYSAKEELKDYQLTTVTYGTKAAPFLAMMTLRQLAIDEGHKYQSSRAAMALQEEFYMDDLVSGSFTLASAKQLQSDLIELLRSGGFNLRKWSSNNKNLLQNISSDQASEGNFDFKQAESTKTLGLRWNPEQDQFSFQLKINTESSVKVTKRTLLSDISKIFDPLGWLSPVTTKLKKLFKQVWLANIQWDDEVPREIAAEWTKIKIDLENIKHLTIERWYQTSENDSIELHGFCDASIKAYACVIYCKIDEKITLIAAKTRLAPENKNLTLPKLELSGAHLLSKLMKKVSEALSNHRIKLFGWTDSTAVLGWIQGDTNRWKPFVANRVSQLKQSMAANCWRYIKSSENPADCASRGISVEQLKNHVLWWKGPNFLPSFNQKREMEPPAYTTEQEVKNSKQSYVATRHSDDDVIPRIVNKQSNLTRAVRVLAWVSRVAQRHRKCEPYLTSTELKIAKQKIIQYVQQDEFLKEIEDLKAKQQINQKSKILSLNPFLDKEGLLRVGGRIKHANISEDMKHPVIIPQSGHLTNLIIDHAHRLTFHGGPRLTLSRIRQQYWVISGNRAVKKRISTCVTCRKQKASKQSQLMGDLPEPRINPTRPFHHTGVDFTGYVDVKLNKGRGVKTTKGYIAVFVCMVTKAVHLELVSDMSTSAFLAALKRMSARRGKPHHLYSDNGTNFVGANRTLQRELAELQQIFSKEFLTEINEMEIQWHYNAPSWPHAGGLWEAAVKSLKHHLKRVVGEQKLTFEEWCTLLAQLEGCLNSRPLCPLTEDPDDLNCLTPSHFLSSGPILSVIDTESDSRTRWHRTQSIAKDIWKRWQSEYLAQLSTRSKWQSPRTNLKVNDIVIIHEPNLPVGKWALGRVTELHPGADGYVRVVTLKTKTGYIKRPIVKLSLLVTSADLSNPNEATKNTSNPTKFVSTSPCSSSSASAAQQIKMPPK